jgi:two-component system, OmpR family, response regulator
MVDGMTRRVRKILVIDDSEVMLGRIRLALAEAGYDVIATSQMVGNARHLPTCDLVILDYHMPGLDGSSVVSSLRAVAGATKKVCPIFLYTSYENIARDYARLGFDGVLTSKGDEHALVRQVAAVFRIAEMREEKELRAEKKGPPAGG